MVATRAVIVGALLARVVPAGAQPCAPRAALDGDAAAVAQVAAELMRLGVAVEHVTQPMPSAGACRVVVAAVELDVGGGIAVSVRDASQRSEGRVVSDAALAAAWIDSWARDDFEPSPALAVAPAEPAVAATRVAVAAADEPSVMDRISLAAGYERTWTADASWWTGIGAAACMRFDEFCLGVRARYATQDVGAQLTAAARSDASVLATASWSHRIGMMTIAPELGIGVGRMSTERIDGCATATTMCDPTTDPSCPPPSCFDSSGQAYVGDNFHVATYTPRLAAAVRLAVPVFEHVWLEAIAAMSYAPFSHTAGYPPTMPPPVEPDGTEPYTPAQVTLPGEPELGFQVGVGIRVGGR